MASEPLCMIEGCQRHYGCRLRAKGLQISPRAQMTQTQNWRPTPAVIPSRNKQIIYDERPGGIKMPLMKPDGTVVRGKYFDENKSKITSTLSNIRAT